MAGGRISIFGSDDTPGVIKRVLGPSADYIGEALGRYTEQRVRNVGRILDAAEHKLGDRALDAGQVPPRVAHRVLDEGSYCDDDVMVEYLGGVLASARTDVGRDDRATRWVSLINGLSSYEVRLHYGFYRGAPCLHREPKCH